MQTLHRSISNNLLPLAFDRDLTAIDPNTGSIDQGELEFVDLAINVINDPVPVVTLPNDHSQYVVRRYGSTTFDFTVFDPGRNVAYIRAIVPQYNSEGDLVGELFTKTQAVSCDGASICRSSFNFSTPETAIYQLADQDTLLIQLPVATNLRSGIYPLYLLVGDTTGNHTVISTEVRILDDIPPIPPTDTLSPGFYASREAMGFGSQFVVFNVIERDTYTLWLRLDQFGVGNTLRLRRDGQRIFPSSGDGGEGGEECFDGGEGNQGSFQDRGTFFDLDEGIYEAEISVDGGEGSFNFDGGEGAPPPPKGFILGAEQTDSCRTEFNETIENGRSFGVVRLDGGEGGVD